MEIQDLIEISYNEGIGKYFFSKALAFAIDKEFGKAYEFFKQGLDILTCDCQGGWLKPNSQNNKEIFNDISVNHNPHFEYYFVKAYIMSYEDDKKSQYLALEAIDRYLDVKNDEYGKYVKGKILIALNENQQALACFENAISHGTNSRLLYKIGRIKEQLLGRYGISELYRSLVLNSSSACCARILKKYMKERGFELVLDEFETNPLLIAFNNNEHEYEFQRHYEKLLKSQLEMDDPFAEFDKKKTISSFIQGIKNNSDLFIEENIEDDEGDYDDDEGDYDNYGSSYEKYGGYNGWSDDVIDDAFEGDPENTWNVD